VSNKDNEIAAHLRRAAEGQVTQSEFYKYLDTWKSETTSPLSELVFEEVEKFWADLTSWRLFKRGALKNILANNRERLRILARALEEGWAIARPEQEVYEW
jgi:chemotaxis methyl-accepting protein methylase